METEEFLAQFHLVLAIDQGFHQILSGGMLAGHQRFNNLLLMQQFADVIQDCLDITVLLLRDRRGLIVVRFSRLILFLAETHGLWVGCDKKRSSRGRYKRSYHGVAADVAATSSNLQPSSQSLRYPRTKNRDNICRRHRFNNDKNDESNRGIINSFLNLRHLEVSSSRRIH